MLGKNRKGPVYLSEVEKYINCIQAILVYLLVKCLKLRMYFIAKTSSQKFFEIWRQIFNFSNQFKA